MREIRIYKKNSIVKKNLVNILKLFLGAFYNEDSNIFIITLEMVT